MASIHEGKKAFKCESCDYSCSQKNSLKQHFLSVHEGIKPFKCDMCDYKCLQNSDIKKHVALVHEGKKLFQCKLCDKCFAEKSKMNKHMASFHEGNNKVKCEVWSKFQNLIGFVFFQFSCNLNLSTSEKIKNCYEMNTRDILTLTPYLLDVAVKFLLRRGYV